MVYEGRYQLTNAKKRSQFLLLNSACFRFRFLTIPTSHLFLFFFVLLLTYQMAGERDASNETIAKVITEHVRKSEIWNSYNMVVLTNGKRKTQCKMYQTLLMTEGNSTLRHHTEKLCPGLRSTEGDSVDLYLRIKVEYRRSMSI